MNEMNVLITSSDVFARYIPALQTSLYENHQGIKIHIFVMHSKISNEIMDAITKHAKKYECEVSEIKVDESCFEGLVKVSPESTKRFPVEVYYQLLAHQYLPANVDRCLYLDTDVICDDNIYDWYCTDFENMFFIAAYRYFKNDYYWFNSGVYILNIKKLREESIGLDFYIKKSEELLAKNKKVLFASQDLLAFSFKEYKDNGFLSKPQDGINYRLPWYTDIALEIQNPPKIKLIHYITSLKAWNYIFDDSITHLYIGEITKTTYDFSVISDTVCYLYNLFWKYAAKAPFYNEIYRDAQIATKELKRSAALFNEQKKVSLMLQAISLRDDDRTGKFLISKAVFNDYGTVFLETDTYIEYRTQYFISDQWIIFPLRRKLKKGEKISLGINCEYKANGSLKLFLADINRKRQELPPISIPEYSCKETIKAEGYEFLCLWSNSFCNVGDYIRIFEMEASVSGENSVPQEHQSGSMALGIDVATSTDRNSLLDKIRTQAVVIEELKDTIIKICVDKSDRNGK